jgi:hypothetical protein
MLDKAGSRPTLQLPQDMLNCISGQRAGRQLALIRDECPLRQVQKTRERVKIPFEC